ncbi:LOW QUALITY PROTEIN: hypothetical protein TorRG33x02_333210 [Trema orientale]|uniref:Uncharacterized protein n=1 Tax=Trema orientale TaxID=63057 RepID=A0A2P5B4A4_TREOI|nr:LOW QUALITY PROTEIN: hypothetical protein TorRG33x02_333210 [Trema orientale]
MAWGNLGVRWKRPQPAWVIHISELTYVHEGDYSADKIRYPVSFTLPNVVLRLHVLISFFIQPSNSDLTWGKNNKYDNVM